MAEPLDLESMRRQVRLIQWMLAQRATTPYWRRWFAWLRSMPRPRR